MKDRLNSRVKQRAWFRPFAPAILEERMTEFFEIEQPDPFMTMAPKVRAGKEHLIPAAVHFDGTARLQTVSRSTNPLLYAVIEKFAELTNVPVVLNTSFNLREPIVETPEDAISCYLRTQMDVLVVGDFYASREERRVPARRGTERSSATYDAASVK
jgi:carbamoyltransferase